MHTQKNKANRAAQGRGEAAQPEFPLAAVVRRVPALGEYVHAVKRSTAASPQSLLAPFLTVVGAAIGRKATWGFGTTHSPLLYTLVIGASNDAAKSTGLGLAARFVALLAGEPALFRGSPSTEGLVERVGKSTTLLVLASEARTWFARQKQQGCAGLASLFTELWDLIPSYDLATRKNAVHVDNPTLAFAGASTASFLEAALDDADFGSGMMNRFCFFAAPAVKLLPIPGAVDEKALERVAKVVTAARETERTYELAGNAKQAWTDEFYALHERRKNRESMGEVVADATKRVDAHAARFALMSAALHRRSTKLIERDDVAFGWTMARYCESAAVAIVREMAFGRIVRLELKIRAFLRRKGPSRRRAIAMALGGGSSAYSSRDINDALDQMVRAETLDDKDDIFTIVGESVGAAGVEDRAP